MGNQFQRKPIVFFTDERGCHVCTSHWKDYDGYPRIKIGGVKMPVSHLAYERRFGPVPQGLILRHTCDNPACINPEHLVPGTHADNVADRVQRGRSAAGGKNGRAKLTPAIVREILASDETTCAWARRLGVDPKTVRSIRQRKIWASA